MSSPSPQEEGVTSVNQGSMEHESSAGNEQIPQPAIEGTGNTVISSSSPVRDRDSPASPESLPPSGNPRLPWTGRIPAFFQIGADGTLIPHFPGLPTGAASPGRNNDSDSNIIRNQSDQHNGSGTPASTRTDSNDNNETPHFHLPPLPTELRLPPFFPFMMPMSGLRNRRPDPEAAAELLRSLPTVEKSLFRRFERVFTAEQVQSEDNGEERGWNCGVCLEGVDGDAKETGVKVLPCNHLFHSDCLEPWFTTNHTW